MNAMAAQKSSTEKIIHVIQGDYAVTDETSVVLTTVLGSCVACCLHDPVAGVGGMNHFLLPGDDSMKDDGLRYGVNSMELLINGLLRYGARRDRLEGKLFGGARVVVGLSNIGDQNASFARGFLKAEGISCVSESLGGVQARRVRYWPSTGRAQQLLLDKTDPALLAESAPKIKPLAAPADSGDLDLF